VKPAKSTCFFYTLVSPGEISILRPLSFFAIGFEVFALAALSKAV
jgi:hypothetical protein